MPFESIGEENSGDDGIPKNWENLENNACPKCGEDLDLFEHVDLWKCMCGFKISTARMDEIVENILEGDSHQRCMFASGYKFGNYDDETPF